MQSKNITEILTFLARSKELETALRYRASMRRMQNSVAEHSWRLGLMALVIARECGVTLNMEHTLELALMHDLAEARTGDIDAYTQITEGSSAAAHAGDQLFPDKALLEEDAMRTMTGDLSFGSWVYDLWDEYEKQETTEAKFVKALDKIEGFLHIAEVGLDAYVPKEFHSNYADAAVRAFDEASHHFPGLADLLDAVKASLKLQCEKAGVAWLDTDNSKCYTTSMKGTLYIASSINGAITIGTDDSSWVSQEDGEMFESMCRNIGAVLVGNTTYQQFKGELYPAPGVFTVVMSQTHESEGGELVKCAQTLDEAVQIFTAAGYTDFLIAGGATLVGSCLSAHLIKRIYLSLHPLVIGSGLPMFKGFDTVQKLEFVGIEKQSPQHVVLEYTVV